MPYPTDFRRRHVRRAVVTHAFIDVEDWAAGLDELAGFTDAEIDALAQDEPSDPTSSRRMCRCSALRRRTGRIGLQPT